MWKEEFNIIEVPKGTGIDGFLRTVRTLLELPRLQEILIDCRGKVAYKHYVRDDESQSPPQIDFESLMPYAVVRNGHVTEVAPRSSNAAIVIGEAFRAAAVDNVYPVAWVTGADSVLRAWYVRSTDVELPGRDEFYGLPVLRDRHVEDSTLLLCAAFGRTSSFAETQRSYKLHMEVAR